MGSEQSWAAAADSDSDNYPGNLQMYASGCQVRCENAQAQSGLRSILKARRKCRSSFQEHFEKKVRFDLSGMTHIYPGELEMEYVLYHQQCRDLERNTLQLFSPLEDIWESVWDNLFEGQLASPFVSMEDPIAFVRRY